MNLFFYIIEFPNETKCKIGFDSNPLRELKEIKKTNPYAKFKATYKIDNESHGNEIITNVKTQCINEQGFIRCSAEIVEYYVESHMSLSN